MKALQILGGIFLTLVVVVGGFIGYFAYTGGQLDASSKAYVDAAIPAIAKDWSEKELTIRAAPQLMQSTTPEQLTKMFAWFKTLGPMKKYCGAKGDSNVFISAQQGKIVSARYVACTQFEKGDATIQVSLIRNADDSWQIAGFRVNSQALVPQ